MIYFQWLLFIHAINTKLNHLILQKEFWGIRQNISLFSMIFFQKIWYFKNFFYYCFHYICGLCVIVCSARLEKVNCFHNSYTGIFIHCLVNSCLVISRKYRKWAIFNIFMTITLGVKMICGQMAQFLTPSLRALSFALCPVL